ncbi:imidazole glycerol phosphate synthase subunit HisH [Alphaproteobacteria bacterium]|nr:imidazole glycerol phosphate synthase subunit HisH [Alphaproteobacteria bacterium]
MSLKVGVLDYGVGNVRSVLLALDELGVTPLLIDRAMDVHRADALIIPGVGGFAECKEALDRGGWSDAILEDVLARQKPLLGICLGMHLLADSSEEGMCADQPIAGLGLIPGRVVSLKNLQLPIRIPHVGWNSILKKSKKPLFDGIPDGTDFYFAHSYGFVPESNEDVIAFTDCGIDITAAVARGNVCGIQFHPEKSSRAGFKLLKNFISGLQC